MNASSSKYIIVHSSVEYCLIEKNTKILVTENQIFEFHLKKSQKSKLKIQKEIVEIIDKITHTLIGDHHQNQKNIDNSKSFIAKYLNKYIETNLDFWREKNVKKFCAA